MLGNGEEKKLKEANGLLSCLCPLCGLTGRTLLAVEISILTLLSGDTIICNLSDIPYPTMEREL